MSDGGWKRFLRPALAAVAGAAVVVGLGQAYATIGGA